MAKDVIITPASGKLDFYATTGGSVLANINLTDNNDLSLSTTSGNLIIGDASRDVYIGDGTNEVDIVFEQNGEIRSVAGKYITVNAGTINATGVAVNTSSPTAVMHVYGSTPSGTVLNVEGTNGSLFSVVDNLDGTLMSVNNNAGLPVLEVFSDDKIVGGRFGYNDFVVSSNGNIGIGVGSPSNKLDISGSIKLRSSLNSVILDVDDVYGLNIDGNLNIDAGSFKISDPDLGDQFVVSSNGSITSGSWNASTIAVNKGGTGATTLTNGEVLVGNGTSAVSTLSRSGIDSRSTFPPASHAITTHSATSWRMFFSNATTSAIQELAFGNAGTFLKSSGPSANPTWSTLTSSDVGLGNVANVAALPLAGGTMTGAISFAAGQTWPTFNQNTTGTSAGVNTTVAVGSYANLVYATIGTNDYFRIRAGGAADAGDVEIATADNGNEPIYVRQYSGAFTTLTRTATLLDSSGNTTFPGSVTVNSLVKSGGTSSQFLKADGSVDSTAYTTNTGTVTGIGAGSGMNFTFITGTGSVTLGTPSNITLSSTNSLSANSHTHAFVPGGTTAQYIRGDGTLTTFPTIPTVNDATLTLNVSGTGLSGSQTFTANQSSNATFTVTSNATSANTASTIVARDASGNFSAGTITAALNGNASTVTNGVYTTGNQSVGGVKTFTSQIINTTANNTTNGGGQIYLNGATGNRIDFNTNGVGVPSLFSRALGSKINLYPSLSTGSATDFAIGLANDGAGAPTRFWQSVDTANSRFEWFAGSTTIGILTGSGVLTIQGGTSQINVDNLRLDGNTLSSTNTNGDLIIAPQSASAKLLTSTTGNTRGTGANDLQRYRLNNTQVAAGAYSVIGGGAHNTASGGASVILGGTLNTASSTYCSVGGGYYNIAGGNLATIGGGSRNEASTTLATIAGGGSFPSAYYAGNRVYSDWSTIGGGGGYYYAGNVIYSSSRGSTISGGMRISIDSAPYSSIGGGFQNKIYGSFSKRSIGGGYRNISSGGEGSIIPGGIAAKTTRYGELSHAAGLFSTEGDAQHSIFVLRGKTISAAQTTTLGLSGVTTSRLTVENGEILSGTIEILGSISTGASVARYKRQFTIKNVGGTTSLVGSIITLGTDEAAGTTISITADNTNDALSISVTRAASETWRWVAVVDCISLRYGA